MYQEFLSIKRKNPPAKAGGFSILTLRLIAQLMSVNAGFTLRVFAASLYNCHNQTKPYEHGILWLRYC